MRYAVISDIYANLKAPRDGFGEIAEHRIDHIVCLGDVLGYSDEPNKCCDGLTNRTMPTRRGDDAYLVKPLDVASSSGDGWYFINVGSVGQPRVGDQHGSFGVFDTESNEYRLVRLT